MKQLLASLALLALAPAAAQAGDWTLGVNGLVGLADTSGTEQLPAPTGTLSSDTDDGINGGAGAWVGYDMGTLLYLPLSVELGSNWRYRHDQNITYTVGGLRADARLDIMTVDTMLSGLVKIPTGTRFTPFVGGGGGVVYLYTENEGVSAAGTTDEGDTSEWNFAWQLVGGFNYDLSENTALRFDYRYIDMGSVNSAVMSQSNTRFKSDLHSHDLRIGAFWKF